MVAADLTETDSHLIRLSGVTLDLARGRLIGPSGDIALRPKSFALLRHLAMNAGQVLSKEDLIAAVWPDVTVTEDSLTQCIRDIRLALGDGAATHLQTVPRRGYLFAADPAANPGSAPHPGSIAVLPLVCDALMTPPDQLLFDGLANDVISRLASQRSFHVIARGSTFALRAHAADPLHAARLLNVAFVVSGTVARLDPDYRLRIDLVNAQGGTIVWTDEIVIARRDIVGMIATLTERISNIVASEITTVERRRALTVPEPSMDAWVAYHRGLDIAFSFDAAKVAEGLRFFQAATDRDPGFARAHAATSFCHYFFAFSGQCADRAAEKRLALLAADRAMQADDRNPTAHWAKGRALWLAGDPEAGLQHCRQAVALSPGFAHAHYMIGFIEAHHGNPARALDQMNRTEALSPFDPFLPSIQITRAVAFFRLGQMDDAALWARKAARHSTVYNQLLFHAALILFGSGHEAEARQIVAAIRALDPNYTAKELFATFYGLHGDLLATYQRAASHLGL